jgi:alkylhydroperoxidase/carboxymuconolactone decarboxylase family protein YurZ
MREDAAMTDNRPLWDALLEMNAASIARVGLPNRELMIARLAALAAVNAPAASYVRNLEAATEAGLSFEDVRDVLVAVAPIVGSPRVLAAADTITDALGYSLAESVEDAIASGELGPGDAPGVAARP